MANVASGVTAQVVGLDSSGVTLQLIQALEGSFSLLFSFTPYCFQWNMLITLQQAVHRFAAQVTADSQLAVGCHSPRGPLCTSPAMLSGSVVFWFSALSGNCDKPEWVCAANGLREIREQITGCIASQMCWLDFICVVCFVKINGALNRVRDFLWAGQSWLLAALLGKKEETDPPG